MYNLHRKSSLSICIPPLASPPHKSFDPHIGNNEKCNGTAQQDKIENQLVLSDVSIHNVDRPIRICQFAMSFPQLDKGEFFEGQDFVLLFFGSCELAQCAFRVQF